MQLITKPQIYTRESDLPENVEHVDAYTPSLRELFFADNPKFRKGTPEAHAALANFLKNHTIPPIWVHYPWLGQVVQTLPEDLYFKLRTARNRNIITDEEQAKYRKMSVGIAGLSVGSAIVSSLVASGGPKTFKICDPDVLEVSNLNRIRGSLMDVGSNKAEVAAARIWELDPFADICAWKEGIEEHSIDEFILDAPRIDIFIDEMDSLPMKVKARLAARSHRVPVIMATDNGDSVIVDVERFDLEPDRTIFHGLIEGLPIDDLSTADYAKWARLATKIIGPEHLTFRMQDSLLSMGDTVSAVPQLGTSAAVAGSAISYVVRQMASGYEMPSGRYTIGLEERLNSRYHAPENVMARISKLDQFKKKFF